MPAFGVDGCSSGWIAVQFDPAAESTFAIARSFASLPFPDRAMVYVDIPIGLPESGDRGCDRAARILLKGAQSRVFLGLRRPLLAHATDYRAANGWAQADGKGLSKQAFAILPKIADVDTAVSPERQKSLRESHPDLVFCRLNGGAPLPSKHTARGLRERRDVLARHGVRDVDLWLGRLRGTGAKPDDLLDACALALAAFEATQGHARRVKCPEARDARGLRMDIWF
jgi:predicted RNase H-like nuclease